MTAISIFVVVFGIVSITSLSAVLIKEMGCVLNKPYKL